MQQVSFIKLCFFFACIAFTPFHTMQNSPSRYTEFTIPKINLDIRDTDYNAFIFNTFFRLYQIVCYPAV
jgi:hypothetical protein